MAKAPAPLDRRSEFRRLNELRDQAGINWAAVCSRAGISYSTIWRALQQGHVPYAKTLGAIGAALGQLIDERAATLKRLKRHGKSSRL